MRAPRIVFFALLVVVLAAPLDAANRLRNPEFDGSIVGWAAGDVGGSPAHSPDIDVDGCVESGSAQLQGTYFPPSSDYPYQASISQCVPASDSAEFTSMGQGYLDSGTDVSGYWLLTFYDTPDCSGWSFGAAGWLVASTSHHEWRDVPPNGWSVTPLPGTRGVKATIGFYSTSTFVVNVDRTYAGEIYVPLFENGFEAGFCRFSDHT